MDFSAVSWLAVALAGLAFFALGGLWYGPVFGRVWMRASGVTEAQARDSNLAAIFGATLVLELVAAAGLAALAGADASPGSTALLGAGVGLLVAAPVLGVNALYERRGMLQWLLIAGCTVLGLPSTVAPAPGRTSPWPGAAAVTRVSSQVLWFARSRPRARSGYRRIGGFGAESRATTHP